MEWAECRQTNVSKIRVPQIELAQTVEALAEGFSRGVSDLAGT